MDILIGVKVFAFFFNHHDVYLCLHLYISLE